MLFKCKYVNNVPTVIPLANMSANITDNASQVSITDTHGISGSVGAVTDLQTLTNTGSQKAMNNLAELVNDATSPKNYAVGDHILRNGQYSKVKQAIQQGGSFTSSNLEAACIGDELSSIISDLANMMIYSNISAGATKTLPGGSYLMLFSRAGTNYGMFATFRDWGLIVPVVQGTAGMTLSISNDQIVIANTSVGATVGMIAIKIT